MGIENTYFKVARSRPPFYDFGETVHLNIIAILFKVIANPVPLGMLTIHPRK